MKKAEYIDHTILKATATKKEVFQLCAEANSYGFKSVCVNPYYVNFAKELLKDSNVLICTVIGFPLGQNTSDVKAYETTRAISDGADEVDMVINIAAMKDKDYDFVRADIKAVVDAACGVLVKVILETCYLTAEEIKIASILAKEAGADFVKTSTGFGSAGATVEAVKIMREAVGTDLGVKASGGIRTKDDMEKMIAAGANRIGCSAGCKIMEEYNNEC